MSVVQAYDRIDRPAEVPDNLIDYRRDRLREVFALELVKELRERGGIVGPIHETAEEEPSFWMAGGSVVTLRMYARVESLPQPEEYRLMGGPADGHIVLTGGAPTWDVPILPPVSLGNPYDLREEIRPRSAHYERQGDTQVYFYRGMS